MSKSSLYIPILVLLLTGFDGTAFPQTTPGTLYKEFARHNDGDNDWRVTDKQAVDKFDQARNHLPNSRMEFKIDDLQHAIRAEFLLDRWGGHVGTVNKRIRFNDHDWIRIPEIEAVPQGIRPEMLMYQDNPTVPVPLEHLVEGSNFFEGDCDERGGFGWGQWGLYSLVLRVYYDPQIKGKDFQISGQITSPGNGETIGDHPIIKIDGEAEMGIARIDVLARYDGYDVDGDGNFNEWQESHFQLVRGEANEIRDHVGTIWKQPYQVRWDTYWIPDQGPAAVSLIARIQNSRGYWTITQPVNNLSLRRNDISVKLYRAIDVPEDFAVRVGQTKTCHFEIPADDSVEKATEAALHLRTWHGWDGHHEPLKINDYRMPIGGKNHFYDYDLLPLPADSLKPGENVFSIHSNTEHHMLETLWPGPAIVTRTPRPQVSIKEQDYEQRPHFVIATTRATYWLDKNSGGLSRLIDREGHDWIAFKTQPWDDYPASSASSYRGLPNLVFEGPAKGFGHPGWDQAHSIQRDDRTILCTSHSGKWQLEWVFSSTEATVTVTRSEPDQPYWFLYEGPIDGRWAPQSQYFATNVSPPSDHPHDYFKEDRLSGNWRWAYFGDSRSPRVLFIAHEQDDKLVDTFSHLGNSRQGLDSNDGMVVFGFGRGPSGIQPLLSGRNSFRLGILEQAADQRIQYDVVNQKLDLPTH